MSYRKWICGVAVFVMAGMLSGCCSHEWYEATCASPRTCSKCGETSGEAREHEFGEANYQQPATCEECGLTQGEVLQPDYEKYGIVCDTKVDTEYPFVNKCYDNDELTTGRGIFTDFDVFLSDDEHEERDGYEWRTVTFSLIFDDENANEYGVGNYGYSISDYYDIQGANESWGENNTFTVNYNGKDYEAIYERELLQNEWGDDAFMLKIRAFVSVPVGYDGIVFWLCDSQTRSLYGEYMNAEEELAVLQSDGRILFRLK